MAESLEVLLSETGPTINLRMGDTIDSTFDVTVTKKYTNRGMKMENTQVIANFQTREGPTHAQLEAITGKLR
jgi:hypothetical protein